jgi:hypothetical protein
MKPSMIYGILARLIRLESSVQRAMQDLNPLISKLKDLKERSRELRGYL